MVYRGAFRKHFFESKGPRDIPDGDPLGLHDSIDVDVRGLLRGIDVRVHLRHATASDVVVTLLAPVGTEILLRDQFASSSDDLQLSFESATHRGLASLLEQPASGPWTLRLRDLLPRGSGRLRSWSLELDVAAPE